jgi:hypothetical protein
MMTHCGVSFLLMDMEAVCYFPVAVGQQWGANKGVLKILFIS